jgi:hypothetical protein
MDTLDRGLCELVIVNDIQSKPYRNTCKISIPKEQNARHSQGLCTTAAAAAAALCGVYCTFGPLMAFRNDVPLMIVPVLIILEVGRVSRRSVLDRWSRPTRLALRPGKSAHL